MSMRRSARASRKSRRAGTPVAPQIRSVLVLLVGGFRSIRRLFGSLFFGRGFLSPLCQRIEEGVRSLWSIDFAGQRSAKWHHATIELAGCILVLLDHSAGETDTGKNAASARVREHLRFQFPVGIGGGIASNRPSS